MKKLFLVRSDDEYRKETGDVIVVLDHVTDLKIGKMDDFFVVALDQVDGSSVARFESEKNAKSFLRKVIEAMGGDTDIVDEYTVFKMDSKKHDMLKTLMKMKKALDD